MNIKSDELLDDLQLDGLMIIQKKHGFKFGVDAVLLSDFAKNSRSKRTLDLCTGTGIIPLLISKKTLTPDICALEIQPDICEMAQRSIEYNKLCDKIHITCGDLKEAVSIYGKASFDKITCNPPYMKAGTAIKNENIAKTISRHEVLCTLDDVIEVSSKLLVPRGKLFMVHRPSRLADILCSMRKHRIEPKILRFVHADYTKEPNLVLIEGILNGGNELKFLPPLYVYNTDGTYTEEIDKIYGRI